MYPANGPCPGALLRDFTCMSIDLKRAASTRPHSWAMQAVYVLPESLLCSSRHRLVLIMICLSGCSALAFASSHVKYRLPMNIQGDGQQNKGTFKGGQVRASGHHLHQVLSQELIIGFEIRVLHQMAEIQQQLPLTCVPTVHHRKLLGPCCCGRLSGIPFDKGPFLESTSNAKALTIGAI